MDSNSNSTWKFIESRNSSQITKSPYILFHRGINDIDTKNTKDIAFNLKELAEAFQNYFKLEVYTLGIIPRVECYTGNNEFRCHLSNRKVKIIDYNNLNLQHLRDDISEETSIRVDCYQ